MKKFVEYIRDNFAHRKQVVRLAKSVEYVHLGILLHDFDKVILAIFLPRKLVSKIHHRITLHHPDNIWGKFDLKHAVLDWESARFTKPDKPLNARQTAIKHYPNHIVEVNAICDKWGF